jgi:hypothetical protein
MVRSLASWLWLLDFRYRGAALDASDDPTGELGASLAGHFDQVHALRPTQTALDTLAAANAEQGWTSTSMKVGTAAKADWPADTFDCVVLYDAPVRRGASSRELRDEVAAWRPKMRRDGWLVAASATPTMLRRTKSETPAISRASFTRQLRAAGYRDVRCLWVEYTLDRPLFMIPADRSTVTAYESYDAMRSSGRRHRRLAARSGMHALLYPGYLLFARA